MSSRKKSQRKKVQTKADRLNIIMTELINDSHIPAEHIGMYQDVVTEFPDIEVENPIFIRANIELMKLRLQVYIKSIQATVVSNKDSLTDSVGELMDNNSYCTYIGKIIEYYDKKLIN